MHAHAGEPTARLPIPATVSIYDSLGGPDLRNPLRTDIAQCSLWSGGPAGTLLPQGSDQPAFPRPGVHGAIGAGWNSACRALYGLAQGSVFRDGAFARATVYGERMGSYTAPDGSRVAFGHERRVYSAGAGFAQPDGSFISLDVTRAERRGTLYGGSQIDSRYFDATSVQMRGLRILEHPHLQSLRFSASYTDVDRLNDNFTCRPLVGAATLARFDRKALAADLALDGRMDRLAWTFVLFLRSDQRDATRYQGPLLAPQSPVIAGGRVTSYGASLDGRYDLGSGRRVLAGARLDLVSAGLGGIDETGYATPGFGATPTARQLFAATYGYAGGGSASEANLGGMLRLEQDIAADGRLYAGIRRVVRTADPRERYFISFTPQAGGTLNPGPIHRTWIGNPGLKPEQHHLAEVGFGWRSGGWELVARAYGDRVADFILWDRTRGQPGVLRADNVGIFRNVDAAIAGLEAKVRYRFASGIWLGADGWLTYGQNLTDDRPIGQIPAAEAQLRAGWVSQAIEIETRLRLVATQDRVDGNFRAGSGVDGTGLVGSEQRTPGFATLDAALTWKSRPNVRLTIGVENILDTAYREHIERTDIDDPFTYAPTATGRSVYLRGLVCF
ncbi:MAG: TonB-dependent receptor [Phreatobacter sp.]|uniref:TonB-dependent receptor domain-containing protein n=1 Tax=Phreatobacter sp. TaxID=1966341 RepID=UPI001A4AC9CF|nr:TonB-dependent receptor [Phreatobacter sp.]MBL8570236.1 TonB-dependent receptor [Phreatobacter sp.]